MPRIPDSFMQSVFYLYRTAADAGTGARNGGTGFFVSVKGADEHPPFLYAVSNWHVVGPAPELAHATVARVNTKGGGTEVLDGLTWVQHPAGDDVSIARVGLVPEHFAYSAISGRLVMRRAEPGEEEAKAREGPFGPGNDVFFVGRYADHEGREQNMPVARFGNIAMMPDDNERIYNPALKLDQESYIVEARSIGGFSGAPVFVNHQYFIDEDGSWDFYMKGYKTPPDPMTHLLGLIWGHGNDFDHVLAADKTTQRPEWVKQNIGLMYVVPSWKLRDLLMDKDEVAMRSEHAKHWVQTNERKSSGVAVDSIGETKSKPHSLSRSEFEDTLRKVTWRGEKPLADWASNDPPP